MTSVNLADVNVFVAALIAAMLVYFFSSLAIRAVGTTAAGDHRRGPPPVPRDARDHGLHQPARLRARRRHHDPRRPARDDAAGRRRGRHADHRRPPPRLPGRGRPAHGRHDRRRPARHRPQQRRRRVGQRQEVHRVGPSPGRERRTSSARRSDAHAAAVVGDTVGDPFKDTAGPSLHVLVKLLATITLVLAPLFIR